MSLPFGFGCFGKVSLEPDYVRLNAASVAAQSLQSWLLRAVETQSRIGGRPIAFQFMFLPSGSPTILLGTAVPSRDQVGRSFPFALFGEFARPSPSSLAENICAMDFLLEITSEVLCLNEGSTDAKTIIAHAQNSAASSASSAYSSREEFYSIIHQERLLPWLRSLYDQLIPDQHFYIFHALALAQDARLWRKESSQSLSLLFPATNKADRTRWTLLASRFFSHEASVAAMFWNHHHLVITLGEAGSQELIALADPDRALTRVWPTWTFRPQAIEQAREALSPELRFALKTENASLESVLKFSHNLLRSKGNRP